jgi:hypothetical protein
MTSSLRAELPPRRRAINFRIVVNLKVAGNRVLLATFLRFQRARAAETEMQIHSDTLVMSKTDHELTE